MEHLQRVENAEGNVTANAVNRDDDAPAATTYYDRFGHGWSDVMDVYETWKETGDLPPTPEADKWHKLNRRLQQS